MKKYCAEFLGTLVLVLFGCGSAAISGGIEGPLSILGIAMAFGLSIVAMAYAIGPVSGCHVNPAVSVGCWLAKRISFKDMLGYVVSQVLGAIAGAGLLLLIINMAELNGVQTTGLGANGFGVNSFVGLSMIGALIVEIILTCVFVLTILGVTAKAETGKLAGLVIGLTLALIHILGIPLTGTSVNPARSIGPALLLGGTPLAQVWVFIVGPIVGAILAAFIYKGLAESK